VSKGQKNKELALQKYPVNTYANRTLNTNVMKEKRTEARKGRGMLKKTQPGK
jgi:hypothetical protein